MAWNHEIAKIGPRRGKVFLFEQGEGSGGGELRRVGTFCMLKLKRRRQTKSSQVKCWAKLAERNAWKSLVGHVKRIYNFWKKRTPSLASRFGENLSKSTSAVHREVRVRVALLRLKD